jgi:hypothetical protein
MSTLILRIYRGTVQTALEGHPEPPDLILDTCIICGYILTILTIVPIFVLVTWGIEAVQESSQLTTRL